MDNNPLHTHLSNKEHYSMIELDFFDTDYDSGSVAIPYMIGQ